MAIDEIQINVTKQLRSAGVYGANGKQHMDTSIYSKQAEVDHSYMIKNHTLIGHDSSKQQYMEVPIFFESSSSSTIATFSGPICRSYEMQPSSGRERTSSDGFTE